MIPVFVNDQACLLRKTESGENHLLLKFFLREHGLQSALVRKRSKAPSGAGLPDLFDIGEATIERKGTQKPAWLKEWSPRDEFLGIARRYKALQAASQIARFYELNLVHMESFEKAWRLLQSALESLSSSSRTDVIVLKVLYGLARGEGYAVREGWLAQQGRARRQAIENLLHQPLREIEEPSAEIEDWIRSLERYLQAETDLVVPAQ